MITWLKWGGLAVFIVVLAGLLVASRRDAAAALVAGATAVAAYKRREAKRAADKLRAEADAAPAADEAADALVDVRGEIAKEEGRKAPLSEGDPTGGARDWLR